MEFLFKINTDRRGAGNLGSLQIIFSSSKKKVMKKKIEVRIKK